MKKKTCLLSNSFTASGNSDLVVGSEEVDSTRIAARLSASTTAYAVRRFAFRNAAAWLYHASCLSAVHPTTKFTKRKGEVKGFCIASPFTIDANSS